MNRSQQLPQTMSKVELKKNKKLLELFVKHKPHPCCYRIIDNASDKHIKFFCECADNIDAGNIPLTSKQYKELKKYRVHIKKLTKKGTSKTIKKKILQEGGFLPALAVPILAALISKIVK